MDGKPRCLCALVIVLVNYKLNGDGMMYNPRGLSWKALFGVLIASLWELLTRWFRPPSVQFGNLTASSAFLPDYIELCGIEAIVYAAGEEIVFDGFISHFGHRLWWFENKEANKLRDVLQPPEDGQEYGRLTCSAVRFDLHAMFNPFYVELHSLSGVISAMDNVLNSGQDFAELLFENDESDSLSNMAEIAIRRKGEDSLFTSAFVGLFHVWYSKTHDDIDVSAEFVREFRMSEKTDGNTYLEN